MSWFEKAFDALLDSRTGNAKRHDLPEVLTVVLTASVCRAENCSGFADFAVDQEDLFRESMYLENGGPNHDTFSHIFHLLDPAAFSVCFGRFLDELETAGAFASAWRLVLGQQHFRTAKSDSEILAARSPHGREQFALVARRHLRGRRSQPRELRARKPRPQRTPSRVPGNLDQAKAKAIGMIQPLRRAILSQMR